MKTRPAEVGVEITIYSTVISSVQLFELLELIGAISGDNSLDIEKSNCYCSYDSYWFSDYCYWFLLSEVLEEGVSSEFNKGTLSTSSINTILPWLWLVNFLFNIKALLYIPFL